MAANEMAWTRFGKKKDMSIRGLKCVDEATEEELARAACDADDGLEAHLKDLFDDVVDVTVAFPEVAVDAPLALTVDGRPGASLLSPCVILKRERPRGGQGRLGHPVDSRPGPGRRRLRRRDAARRRRRRAALRRP